MRILHVVTLVTPDGAYGGPVRVALNQARALRDRGEDVTVVATTRGFDTPPTEIDGVPVRLFPARTLLPGTGYAGLSAPAMLRWFRRHGREFDVVHVHLARDLVTLPLARMALRRRVPVVTQTHGMIDASGNALARPLDAALTRPVLRSAATNFFLTPRERGDILAAGARNPVELTNGVPAAEPADPTATDVLYLARLHSRKRPAMFVKAAHALIAAGVEGTFSLVGPDEGEGARVRSLIESGSPRVRWEGALAPEQTVERMRTAAVYVLPSVDEPYPMSVLEAMSVGVPVVITDSCGLAPLVRESGSGLVVDSSLAGLTGAIESLVTDPARRAEMGARAAATVHDRLGMDAVIRVLTGQYRSAVQP